MKTKKSVGIGHVKDGYEIYDKERFDKCSDRILEKIIYCNENNIILNNEDIISAYIDEEDGDSAFYQIKSKAIYGKPNDIFIHYWVADIEDTDLFS